MTKDEQITRLILDRKQTIDDVAIIKAIDHSTIVGFAIKTNTTVYGKKMPNVATGILKTTYFSIIAKYDYRIVELNEQIDKLLNP